MRPVNVCSNYKSLVLKLAENKYGQDVQDSDWLTGATCFCLTFSESYTPALLSGDNEALQSLKVSKLEPCSTWAWTTGLPIRQLYDMTGNIVLRVAVQVWVTKHFIISKERRLRDPIMCSTLKPIKGVLAGRVQLGSVERGRPAAARDAASCTVEIPAIWRITGMRNALLQLSGLFGSSSTTPFRRRGQKEAGST